jgi:hypothetical protein
MKWLLRIMLSITALSWSISAIRRYNINRLSHCPCRWTTALCRWTEAYRLASHSRRSRKKLNRIGLWVKILKILNKILIWRMRRQKILGRKRWMGGSMTTSMTSHPHIIRILRVNKTYERTSQPSLDWASNNIRNHHSSKFLTDPSPVATKRPLSTTSILKVAALETSCLKSRVPHCALN